MTELYALYRPEESLTETWAEALPAWRRAALDELKNPGARQECLWAGLLFSYVMHRHGIDPEEPVTLLPMGKPVFSRRRDLFFSLSHAGRYVLCGIGDRPVGVDAERIREVKLSLVRRFHPAEQAWLAALPDAERQAALFRLWTRKEAWVKAVSGDRMLSLSEADVIHGLPELCFRDYTLPEGYAAAICTAGAALPELTTVSPAAVLRN